MGVRGDGNGHGNSWKLLIGLSVVCAVLVFLGGFLHRRASDSAIADRQAKSVAFVNTKVVPAVKDVDLSGPLKEGAAASFTKQLDVPAGTDLRLFSLAGVPLYSSPGLAPFSADAEGIQTAVSGDQSRVIDGSDLRVYVPVDGKGAKPVAIAAVVSNYTQLRHDAVGPLDAVRLPIVGLGIVLLIAGLLLMLQSTKGAAVEVPANVKPGRTAPPKVASSSKGRVTGFDPVPVTVGRPPQQLEEEPAEAIEPVVSNEPISDVEPAATGKTFFGRRLGSKNDKKKDPADEAAVDSVGASADPQAKAKRSLFARKTPSADAPATLEPRDDKTASALEREVAIRQALEDQLEQLRTRIQMQDVETNNATKELLAQLDAANRRAEEAEARANDAGPAVGRATTAMPIPRSVPDEAGLRVEQLEREVAEARSVTAGAVARAEALQRQLDQAQAAPAPPAPDVNAEAKVAEAMAQLTDAQQRASAAEQRASAAEQRAASVESVRDELEVRVAQLGTKTTDLEQRATELEASLNEANAGGDAVRAEVATLTAALAAANARVTELESAPPPAVHNEGDRAEIARLRGELANHMERAQAAEQRAATLEADVLAAQRGVAAIAEDAPDIDAAAVSAQPEPADEVTLASRFAADEADVPRKRKVPEAVTSSEPRDSQTAAAVTDEAAVRSPEPPAQEPEAHGSDVPASLLKSEADVAAAVPDAEPQGAAPASVSSNTWGPFHAAARPQRSDESGPPADLNSDHAQQEVSETIEPAPVDTAVSDPVAHEPEPHERRPGADERDAEATGPHPDELGSAPDENGTAEPVQVGVHQPQPVKAQPAIEDQAPVAAEPPAPAQPQRTPTLEWHAPAATAAPAVPSTASNANGIPPAPSDEARYGDIWTAAFAPPQADVAHDDDGSPSEPEGATSSDEETEPATAVAQAPQPPAADVPLDDQLSPPEDEISAEDEMWSLRARLADAALRKKPSHRID